MKLAGLVACLACVFSATVALLVLVFLAQLVRSLMAGLA